MSTYATAANLQERYVSATEFAFALDAENDSALVQTRAQEAIDTAEGQINGRLAVRYLTPVVSSDTAVQNMLRGMTLDIAEYRVCTRAPDRADALKEKNDAWVTYLDQIVEGKAEMPGATTLPSTTSRGTTASWSGSNRTLPDPGPRTWSRETASAL